MKPWIILSFILAVVGAFTFADDATTQETIIDASDKDAITSHIGKEVTVRGEIAMAAWSRSGKVMNIDFKDVEESKLMAVVFEAERKAMDEAFAGDVAKALTGAKVKFTGELQEYGGRIEAYKGRPQMILKRVTQITIVEAAPATQPGS